MGNPLDDFFFLVSLYGCSLAGLVLGLALAGAVTRYVRSYFVRSHAIFLFGLIIGVALGILICLVVLGIAMTTDGGLSLDQIT